MIKNYTKTDDGVIKQINLECSINNTISRLTKDGKILKFIETIKEK